MQSPAKTPADLADIKVPVKLKLAALWTSVMFCYLYGDYFTLYKPGALQAMLDGKIAPFGPTTQGVLLGVTIAMTIPALMISLSLVLRPVASRWLNVIVGVLYTVFVLVTMQGAWGYYLFLGTVDMVLTAVIVWVAWTWPKQATP
jgi:hypothetical protein